MYSDGVWPGSIRISEVLLYYTSYLYIIIFTVKIVTQQYSTEDICDID